MHRRGAHIGLPCVHAKADATDRPFSCASAAAAGLEHYLIEVSLEDLLREELPSVIKVGTQSAG